MTTVIDGCDTVPSLFRKRVAELGDKVALREKDFGIWNEYTWADYGEQARLAGLGLKALGLERGDTCSVASEVNKEWMFADLGVVCTGGITNGVYPTDAPNQVEYLINDSGTRFYFAEDEEQLDKVLEVRERTPTLAIRSSSSTWRGCVASTTPCACPSRSCRTGVETTARRIRPCGTRRSTRRSRTIS